jgi:hypothetical protein
METNDLIAELHRLSVEVRPTACQGCGQEHECSIHGCMVLRETAKWIEAADQDLKLSCFCHTCKNIQPGFYEDQCLTCKHFEQWKWRGPHWKVETHDLLASIRRLALDGRPTACQGCGQEHGCSVHGCTILKSAIAWIDAAEQDLKLSHRCSTCKHIRGDPDENPCLNCKVFNKWEWRGPQEEETEHGFL